MPIRVCLLGIAAVIAATLSLLGVWSVRMALADSQFQQATLAGTEKAILLEPDGAAYHVRLAAIITESDPAGSERALERAVALNPWDSQSWVELGLRAEADGDLAGAERSLLRAAAVDTQYFPKWSLANYYFRRGDSAKFWFWARQAAGMAYGDLAPLFSLSWKVSSDGNLIERELDLRQADLQANYLAYLIAQNKIDPMTRAATRLLGWNREAHGQVLLTACDRLIAENRPDQAIQIWNKLAESHAVPLGPLAPGSGSSLTNADFTVLPISRGFDWRVPDVEGVTALIDGRPRALRVSFSGRQPESCEVMTQFLPLVENSSYELRFLSRTDGIGPASGLAWRVTDLTGPRILAQGESISSENETEGRLRFLAPRGSRIVRLALTYQRALGTPRIEGSISLRKIRLLPIASVSSIASVSN